jgi:hypothetical protein
MLSWFYKACFLPDANDDLPLPVLLAAVAAGHLQSVRWLHEVAGYAMQHPHLLQAAARHGCTAVFKYLLQQGADLSLPAQPVETYAVISGSVELLTYIQSLADRPLSTVHAGYRADLLWCAGMLGHVDIIQLLRSQGVPWPPQLQRLELEQQQSNETQCWSLPALQYAISAGCPWGAWQFGVCSQLVACGYEAEVRWAHANGCPCGADCPERSS